MTRLRREIMAQQGSGGPVVHSMCLDATGGGLVDSFRGTEVGAAWSWVNFIDPESGPFVDNGRVGVSDIGGQLEMFGVDPIGISDHVLVRILVEADGNAATRATFGLVSSLGDAGAVLGFFGLGVLEASSGAVPPAGDAFTDTTLAAIDGRYYLQLEIDAAAGTATTTLYMEGGSPAAPVASAVVALTAESLALMAAGTGVAHLSLVDSIPTRHQYVEEYFLTGAGAGAPPSAILDQHVTTASFQVPDFGTSEVSYVSVSLYATHTYPGDVTISLVHPDGTTAVLFRYFDGDVTDFGESSTERLTFVWDAAATPIYFAEQDQFGSFRPDGNLGVMAGKAIAGPWTLTVADTSGGDIGELVVATLCVFDSTIVAPVAPEPPVASFEGSVDSEGWLSFDGSASTGTGPLDYGWEWDLDNVPGEFFPGWFGPPPVPYAGMVGYQSTGTKTVTLTVEDANRLTDTATHEFEVTIAPRTFPGRLFVTDGQTIYEVVPFASHLTSTLVEIVAAAVGHRYNSVSASPDGTQIAFVDCLTASTNGDVYVCNIDGSGLTLIASGWWNVAWSPDGDKLAITKGTSASGVVNMAYWDLSDSTLHNIRVQPPGFSESPFLMAQAWSPSSDRLVFHFRDGATSMHKVAVIDADGTDFAIISPGFQASYASWRSDGIISYMASSNLGGGNIHTINPDGTGDADLGYAYFSVWSPDNTYAASRNPDIYSTLIRRISDGRPYLPCAPFVLFGHVQIPTAWVEG